MRMETMTSKISNKMLLRIGGSTVLLFGGIRVGVKKAQYIVCSMTKL